MKGEFNLDVELGTEVQVESETFYVKAKYLEEGEREKEEGGEGGGEGGGGEREGHPSIFIWLSR